MSFRKRVAAAIERYDEVMEADPDDPDAGDICVEAIRTALEEEADPGEVNLNNPIAKLQERAQDKRGPMPEYTFADVGNVHAPSFKCVCVSEGVRGEGSGPNKQTAKRRAAQAVLEIMHGMRKA